MNVFEQLRLPDLFTLLNSILGLASVLAALQGEIKLSVIFILLATVADGLDGFVARRSGSGPLGANLDSLADLVSFGVAPAVLAAAVIGPIWPVYALGSIYLICGTLRLARFNISPKNDSFFEGLPIPAAGVVVSASTLFGRQELILILMLLLSVLMVSSFAYPKVRDLRISSVLAIIFLASAFVIWENDLAAIAEVMFFAAAIAYLSSPVVMPYLKRGK